MKILQRGAFFSNREVVLLLLASPFGEVESTEGQQLDYTQKYIGIHRNTEVHTEVHREPLETCWRRGNSLVHYIL